MRLLPLAILPLLLAACSAGPAPESPEPTPEAASPGSSANIPLLSGMHTIILHTSKGEMRLELNADAAPKTVTNFITLAKRGAYDALTFHRVIADFMIQGGDPEGTGRGGESIFGPTFEDEINAESYGLHEKKLSDYTDDELPAETKDWTLQQYYEAQGYVFRSDLPSLPMVRGAIAMANRGPNTNGSQFFIVQAESTPWLEGKHTVFGKVTEGLEIVDAIAEVPTEAGGKPQEPITFTVEVE